MVKSCPGLGQKYNLLYSTASMHCVAKETMGFCFSLAYTYQLRDIAMSVPFKLSQELQELNF